MEKPRVNLAVLVDDNEVDLFVQRKFIELNQFSESVVSFTSPQEAIVFLQGGGQPPSTLIFLDLNMPIMDGFAFLEKVNAMPKDVSEKFKVIVLTSSTSSHDQERAGRFKQVVHFMSKPLSKNDLDKIWEKVGSVGQDYGAGNLN